MYVEFKLPESIAGASLLLLRRSILDWSEKYQIPYTEKTIKYTYRVCFDKDESYSFFAMTYPQTRHFLQYRIVSDLNNKI
jgi:hypothetical protein